MRIYLVGYMGSGKSTVSKRLAQLMNFECVDLDQLFEEKFKIEIADFFKKYDESLFRLLESRLLKDTLKLSNTIIATGGGTPCFYDNMEWMNQNGITVYLQMHPLSIVYRLNDSKKKRPLVASKSQVELISFVRDHLRQRNIYYSQANIIIKSESLNINELSEIINSNRSYDNSQ
ncbi:MAG: shikimate kinase [Bacteroidetes bacterium HGW-Bacteroidetes-1]|nr:MAG: shikimate kinase [Bacteroidetes bacterium HGW-Bacteroidetes-1]